MVCLNATDCFYYHCLKKLSPRNWQLLLESIFNPSATQRGPGPVSVNIEPQAHPSGPTSVNLISSVHKTLEKPVLKYFCPVLSASACAFYLKGAESFHTLPVGWKTLQIPGKLEFCKMIAVEAERFLEVLCLRFHKSLTVNLWLFFPVRLLPPCVPSLTNPVRSYASIFQ